ncbi:MAG: M20/M25/M40 family metallo-hydrolase [Anaerolineae bacterium]|nr:M20/M25/M40 family metallo-hydrolase [Anaerolineae bacterium]
MNALLKQLTEVNGVSGDEKAVRLLLRDLIKDHVDDYWADAVGNLIALKKGTGESDLRVMVDAHMDEIGLVVKSDGSDGTLEFDKLGGIDNRTLSGKVVHIGKDKIPGVIGLKPVHQSSIRERSAVPSDLRIDIGANKKEEINGKVKISDHVAFVSSYTELGPTAIGKAFDDRAGCAAIVELLRGERYPFDLYATFTVQEETGMAGALVASYRVKPDVAVVLECTPAYDLPNEKDVSANTKLGAGPCIYVMDNRTMHDPRLVKHVMESAEKHHIPFQIRQPGGGGTNAGKIQQAHIAVPVVTVGLPGRHAHTPNGMISLDDYKNYVKLADAALRELTRDTITRNS